MEVNVSKQRKNILKQIDDNIEVTNINLAMYDLTPYYNEENCDNSLYEYILLNKNYQRKIEHVEKNIYFSPPQVDALNELIKNDRVIMSAPTSFGKTLIVKEYIYRFKPDNIVYIVPTNALSYELEKSFKENKNFSDYVIYDKLLETLELKDNKKMFIGTQEKYLELDKEIIGDVDLFVIDEAYKLQEKIDGMRAYKLSSTFLDAIINCSKKLFLLTPMATFNGFDSYNFKLFESDFNAVDKVFKIISEDSFYDVFMRYGKNDKTILYCDTPTRINIINDHLVSRCDCKIETNFSNQLKKDIHPDWSVIKLLESGILTHHGQMPKYIQNKMINLFNNDDSYNILVGTNSISEGINTVTKNLFIQPQSNINDKVLLKNTIGRAGRLGEYPIGYIFTTKSIEEEVDSNIEISLAISDSEELKEIEDSKKIEKIEEFSSKYNIDVDFCKQILKKYKISLIKLDNILTELKKDYEYEGISNLPFICNSALGSNYKTNPNDDKLLMKGHLQWFYYNDHEKHQLITMQDKIDFYKMKTHQNISNSEVINLYMRFIYSTLEYNIMPIVNIGLDIYENDNNWQFGKHVVNSLLDCKKKYYNKNYGNLDLDNMPDSYINILNTLKEYGMTSSLNLLNKESIQEIYKYLNVRYSTFDVINAIKYLSQNSSTNSHIFRELVSKYIDF